MIQQMNHLSLKQEIGFKINDESQGMYTISNQIKFKTSMIRSNLCDFDACIDVKGSIIATNTGSQGAKSK